jgi:hypothetical protein
MAMIFAANQQMRVYKKEKKQKNDKKTFRKNNN